MTATAKLARPGTAKRAAQDEAAEYANRLREVLPPGSTCYTVLRHCARSGMSRSIDLFAMGADGPQCVTFWAARVLGDRIDQKHGGIVVPGCGMDMGFHLTYALANRLYPGGTDANTDGGYSLKHRWL